MSPFVNCIPQRDPGDPYKYLKRFTTFLWANLMMGIPSVPARAPLDLWPMWMIATSTRSVWMRLDRHHIIDKCC